MMITFRIKNETNGKEYKFPLKFENEDGFFDWIEQNGDEYDTFMDEVEKYGVHDFTGKPGMDEVEKYGVHDFTGKPGIVGYSSYEIIDFKPVLKLWVEFWMKHNLYGGKIK